MEKEIIITDYSILEVEEILHQIIDSKKSIFPKTGKLIGSVKHGVFHASVYKTIPVVLVDFLLKKGYLQGTNQKEITHAPDRIRPSNQR
jgi:hypothetical protein